MRGTTESAKVKHHFVTGAKTQFLVAKTASTIWGNALLKHHDALLEKVKDNIRFESSIELRNSLLSSLTELFPLGALEKAVIDWEPRGVNLAGKVTNFHTYHGVGHGSKCKELNVCRSSSGGCGQGRSFSNSPHKKC